MEDRDLKGRLCSLLAFALAAAGAGLASWLAPAGFVGRFNDDALYAASAVSLAGGHGYSYLFGPEAAPATRFPPLFAAFLVPAVWAGGGNIYDTVTFMQALAASASCAFVLASYWACRTALGLSGPTALAAIGPVALHPVLVRYGAAVMSDTLAAALGMVALGLAARAERVVADRESAVPPARLEVPVMAGDTGELLGIAVLPRTVPQVRWWERARLAAWWPVALALALAILTRYAALALLAGILAALLLRRRPAEAAGVAAVVAACLLPWGVWAVFHHAAEYGVQAQQWRLAAVPDAVWRALGFALPGWLIPQVFLAGYPLGAEAAGAAGRLPQGLVGVWGLLVSLSIAGPLWKLARSGDAAGAGAAISALLAVLVALIWCAGFPGMGVDLPARLLVPVAPLLAGGLWLWQAGEHRIERAAADRFKGRAAAGWAVAVVLFAPLAIGPVREEAARFARFLPEHRALLAAVEHFARPGDRVATMRPAGLWLYTGRAAVNLPVDATDLPAAVRTTGARFVVGEPFFRGETDVVREALTRSEVLHPDWLRPVYTTPERRLALFEVTEGSGGH